MKKSYYVIFISFAATMSLLYASCNKWNDCSEERANNYGRPSRNPKLYNTVYMTLSEFSESYWMLVDGDTLRLTGYLRQYRRQNGDDEDGYFLYLHSFPLDSVYGSKDTKPRPDYRDGVEVLITQKNIRDLYNKREVRSIDPYVTEDCYDTLKYRLCEIEGVVRFPHFSDVQFCREAVYLYISDWEEQLNHILN